MRNAQNIIKNMTHLAEDAGRAPRQCYVGDVIHHRSKQIHAIEIIPGPLLVAAFWRGEASQKDTT